MVHGLITACVHGSRPPSGGAIAQKQWRWQASSRYPWGTLVLLKLSTKASRKARPAVVMAWGSGVSVPFSGVRQEKEVSCAPSYLWGCGCGWVGWGEGRVLCGV